MQAQQFSFGFTLKSPFKIKYIVTYVLLQTFGLFLALHTADNKGHFLLNTVAASEKCISNAQVSHEQDQSKVLLRVLLNIRSKYRR